jgi:hypothetical protein
MECAGFMDTLVTINQRFEMQRSCGSCSEIAVAGIWPVIVRLDYPPGKRFSDPALDGSPQVSKSIREWCRIYVCIFNHVQDLIFLYNS